MTAPIRACRLGAHGSWWGPLRAQHPCKTAPHGRLPTAAQAAASVAALAAFAAGGNKTEEQKAAVAAAVDSKASALLLASAATGEREGREGASVLLACAVRGQPASCPVRLLLAACCRLASHRGQSTARSARRTTHSAERFRRRAASHQSFLQSCSHLVRPSPAPAPPQSTPATPRQPRRQLPAPLAWSR